MVNTLYQRKILDHARQAVGGGQLDDRDARVDVNNPLCGDRVSIDIRRDGGRIGALAHRVRGCVLCQAAASIMGAHAVGATKPEIADVQATLKALLVSEADPPNGAWRELEAFLPVREYKSRHLCVLLPFVALGQALDEGGF